MIAIHTHALLCRVPVILVSFPIVPQFESLCSDYQSARKTHPLHGVGNLSIGINNPGRAIAHGEPRRNSAAAAH